MAELRGGAGPSAVESDADRAALRRLPLAALPGESGVGREASPFPVPRYLYLRLAASNICNFRCKHCHIWMNRNPRNGLSTERRVKLVREFARLRPGGTVEFPGGEVTLAFNELCTLASASSDAGLSASVVTNGSNLQTPAAAERLVASGLRAITVSLDSHRPEVHDYVRGVTGAFQQATRALQLLVAARRRQGNSPRAPAIQAIGVVFDRNVGELAEYVEFCRSLQIDRVCLQVLNHTFDNHHPSRDPFFERHFWHGAEAKAAACAALRDVILRYASDPFLTPGPRDLPHLEGAIQKTEAGSSDVQCAAHWRNVVVDTNGRVSLCFEHPDGAPARTIGSVARSSLTIVLASHAAAVMRRYMEACRKPCAELECHRPPSPPVAATALEGERAAGP